MDVSNISKKFRALRRKRNCSLAELAKQSGVSKSYLSKIENEMNVPSLVVMRKIADALDVDSTYFMTDETEISETQITRNKDRSMLPFGLGPEKYHQAPLAQTIAGRTMDPYYVEVPHNDDTIYQNEGDRLYFLLEGKVEGSIGGEHYTMEAGDSVYLTEGVPHTSRSISKKPAKGLMISSIFKRVKYSPPFSESVNLPADRKKGKIKKKE